MKTLREKGVNAKTIEEEEGMLMASKAIEDSYKEEGEDIVRRFLEMGSNEIEEYKNNFSERMKKANEDFRKAKIEKDDLEMEEKLFQAVTEKREKR